jgi:hypothetical protein
MIQQIQTSLLVWPVVLLFSDPQNCPKQTTNRDDSELLRHAGDSGLALLSRTPSPSGASQLITEKILVTEK